MQKWYQVLKISAHSQWSVDLWIGAISVQCLKALQTAGKLILSGAFQTLTFLQVCSVLFFNLLIMSTNFIHLVAYTLTRAITTLSTMELPLLLLLLLGSHATQAGAENALQLSEFDLLTFLPLLPQCWDHRGTAALYSYHSVQINSIST